MKKSLFIVVLFSIGGLLWADTRPNIVFVLKEQFVMYFLSMRYNAVDAVTGSVDVGSVYVQ